MKKTDESGFIPMMLAVLVILIALIVVVFLRVRHAHQ